MAERRPLVLASAVVRELPSGDVIPVAAGGTGASTAAAACSALGVGTEDSPQFTAIELGHASDTTLARSAAGQVTIEGVQIATASNAMTLSNKTLENFALSGYMNVALATDTVSWGKLKPQGDDRIGLGWGGAGGANLEISHKGSSLYPGHLALVYGGGASIGQMRCVHYNGTDWLDALSVDHTLTATFGGDVIFGKAYCEKVYAITDGAAFEIDPSNGTIQTITLGASRTPKGTNFADGESVTLMVNDGSAYALTWTNATWGGSGVVWVAATAPVLDTTRYTVIVLWKVSGQVYGTWRAYT